MKGRTTHHRDDERRPTAAPRRIRSALVLTATAALALTTAGDAAAQEGTFRWSDAMRQGRTLTVEGIAGEVRATLAEGSKAEVVATKRGDRDDFDRVEILVFEDDGDVEVCAVYDARRTPESCDHDHHDDRWDDEDDDLDVSVDFEVRVPAGVRFDGSTVAGDVEATGLRSDVTGSTVSGDVRLSTTGSAWGSTVSGDLDLEMGRLDPRRTDFSTVSGDITLRLPASFDAEIRFESVSGDFRSDFDGRFDRDEGKWVGTEVWGTIGSGGQRIRLETVSGNAYLRRRAS